MSDSHAEQLDPTVLGEEVGDDRMPAEGYPADEALAVDDENIVAQGMIARDDVASREDRLADDDTTERSEAPALIEPGAEPDLRDDEQQMIADTGDRDDSPEAAALHVTDDG